MEARSKVFKSFTNNRPLRQGFDKAANSSKATARVELLNNMHKYPLVMGDTGNSLILPYSDAKMTQTGGWTCNALAGQWSFISGAVSLAATGPVYLSHTLNNLITGNLYVVQASIMSMGAASTIQYVIGGSMGSTTYSSTSTVVPQTNSARITAGGTNDLFSIYLNTGAARVDNIFVYPANTGTLGAHVDPSTTRPGVDSMPSTTRFVTTSDNLTVIDHQTNLMWVKNMGAVGVGLPGVNALMWMDLADAVKRLTFAGFSDWRLPTNAELYTILSFQETATSAAEFVPGCPITYVGSNTNASPKGLTSLQTHMRYIPSFNYDSGFTTYLPLGADNAGFGQNISSQTIFVRDMKRKDKLRDF